MFSLNLPFCLRVIKRVFFYMSQKLGILVLLPTDGLLLLRLLRLLLSLMLWAMQLDSLATPFFGLSVDHAEHSSMFDMLIPRLRAPELGSVPLFSLAVMMLMMPEMLFSCFFS